MMFVSSDVLSMKFGFRDSLCECRNNLLGGIVLKENKKELRGHVYFLLNPIVSRVHVRVEREQARESKSMYKPWKIGD